MPLRPGDDRFLPELKRFTKSNVNLVSLNIGFGDLSLDDHLRNLAAFRQWINSHPDRYLLVRSTNDVDRAIKEKKLGITFDMEGLSPLAGGDFGMIAMLEELGVKWALIAYNRNNSFGGGCLDHDTGLTPLGRQAIIEMERVGMVVCCSHTGHKTARDVLSLANKPVIFSHSNPASVFAHERNIPDDLIQQCAETGGVIGINGIEPFLGNHKDPAIAISRHIDHIVQLTGPDHVGLGLDFVFDLEELMEYLNSSPNTFTNSGEPVALPRFFPPEGLVRLTDELLGLGYKHKDIKAILGGNWRRVAETCWNC